MKLNDAIFGALFLALSLFVLWSIQSYPKIPGQDVGPAAFPGLVASLLAICSLMLIVRGWRERAAQPWFVAGAWLRSPRHAFAFALTVGGLLLYVLVGHIVGFLVGSTVFLAVLMLALGVRVPVVLAVAPAATLFIHLVFYKGLRVPLPWGVLPVLY
jgi:putative tricarboxylic transport membrane protein